MPVNAFGQTILEGSSSSNSTSGGSNIIVSPAGGLGKIGNILGIKLDPNPSNDLSLSTNGLIGNGIKYPLTSNFNANGFSITNLSIGQPLVASNALTYYDASEKFLKLSGTPSNLDMNNKKIIGLDQGYPVLNNSQATSWAQVAQLVVDSSNASWVQAGSNLSITGKLGSLNNFDFNIIRNNINYINFNNTEIQLLMDINANNKKIYNLLDPVGQQDAANKRYVDAKKVMNNVGFIPEIYFAISKYGFTVTTSSQYNSNYPAWGVFYGGGLEWATAGVQVNGWLQIKLPVAMPIWKFTITGRTGNGERWYNWWFGGGNDGITWTILKSATGDYLGSTMKTYILAPTAPYLYYIFYGVQSEPTNPGLSHLQIYTVDSLA